MKFNGLAHEAKKLIDSSQHIVIIQADNPDADSLGSALALEQILSEINKNAVLYCAVDMPSYLHYMTGWSRVVNSLPSSFDLVIVVDVSTNTLLEKITLDNNYSKYQSSNKIVIDHHEQVENTISSDVTINCSTMSSTGEVIFNLCKTNSWPISTQTGELILCSILGDTQGLSNQNTSPDTYRIVADLIDIGVNRVDLEENRRKHSKMAESIYRYKAELIMRTQFFLDNRLALVAVPQSEINEHSPLYNPAALIQADMLQVENVLVSIIIKHYSDGKITAAIRSNTKAPIAAKLAKTFGGGGHANASGFKIVDGSSLDEVTEKVLHESELLLNNELA